MCFLNTIKIIYVAVIVQAVTAISPECSAANGVMSAIYFFFAVMGEVIKPNVAKGKSLSALSLPRD